MVVVEGGGSRVEAGVSAKVSTGVSHTCPAVNRRCCLRKRKQGDGQGDALGEAVLRLAGL